MYENEQCLVFIQIVIGWHAIFQYIHVVVVVVHFNNSIHSIHDCYCCGSCSCRRWLLSLHWSLLLDNNANNTNNEILLFELNQFSPTSYIQFKPIQSSMASVVFFLSTFLQFSTSLRSHSLCLSRDS